MRKAYFLAVQEQWDLPSFGTKAGDWSFYEFDTIEELRREAEKFKSWNELVENPINYKMLIFDEDAKPEGFDGTKEGAE